MVDEATSPSKEGNGFRATIGFLAIGGSLLGFGALFIVHIPSDNKEPLLLALGYVFGWGSAVMQSEYGASSTGRKMADVAVKQAEGKTNG
jgi:hypothetical protein